MLYTPLDTIEDPTHSLLERPSPSYSRTTVRRALAVWLYCGQKNSFRAVCDYYHRLEKLEDQLPEDRRQSSRHPEMDLFLKRPPTSAYLKQNYPSLYTHTFDINYFQKLDDLNPDQDLKFTCNTEKNTGMYDWRNEVKAAVKNEKDRIAEKCKTDNGATKREIVETSQMIGKFCKNSKIALKTFLEDFKDHAIKCELKDTVLNVGFYIKRKMIHDEMTTNIQLRNFPNLKVSKTQKDIKKTLEADITKNKSNTYAEATKLEDQETLETRKASKRQETAAEMLEKSLKCIKIDKKCDADMTSPIRLLRRETALNGKTGFQNNFGKVDTLKCRKI